jgi:hypothetical protein
VALLEVETKEMAMIPMVTENIARNVNLSLSATEDNCDLASFFNIGDVLFFRRHTDGRAAPNDRAEDSK